MRFFKEYNGFLFEFNSLSEFLRFLLGRLLGAIVGVAILIGILYFYYWYGNTH